MAYEPKPLDTTHIRLPADLFGLLDKLARNTHEVWARKRLDEGWTYGPQRDDKRRETPLLVPYDELPESERDYDRKVALETVKYVLALGYEFNKSGDSSP